MSAFEMIENASKKSKVTFVILRSVSKIFRWIFLFSKTISKNYDSFSLHLLFIGMNPEKSLASVSALTDAQRDVHSGWVNTWQNVIIALDGYVRDFHPRGLKWKKSE